MTSQRRTGVDTSPENRAENGAEVLVMARGGGFNLIGAMSSQAVLFLLTLLLARKLTTQAVGLYSQAAGFLALLEVVCLSGFRSALTRFVAVHRADDDPASLRGTVRIGLGVSLVSAALLGAGLFLLAPRIAQSVFDDPELAVLLRFVAVTLAPTVFTNAALSATQGFKTMRYHAGIGLLAVPVLRLAVTAVLLLAGSGLIGVMSAVLVADLVGAVLAGCALYKLMGHKRVRPVYRLRELFRFSGVSWLANLASTGLIWADMLLLGIYRPNSEVGVYMVAARLALFATVAMAPINSSFAPSISDLWHRRQFDQLRRAYTAATSWILRISLPAFVGLVVFPTEALGVFGDEFSTGAAVVILLVVGKLTDAATGPCGLMLNQSGRIGLSMADNVGVLVLNVALNIYLIPRHGIVGAAAAWAISLVLVNLVRLVQVKMTMGMVPFDAASAKGLVAALGALVAGFGVDRFTDGTSGFIAGLATILVVYVAGLVALGLPADDRMVGRDLLRRVRGRGAPAVSEAPVASQAPPLGPSGSGIEWENRWLRRENELLAAEIERLTTAIRGRVEADAGSVRR